MTINETIEQLIKEFNQFDDWMDKYNYLIEMGRSVPLIVRVQGCAGWPVLCLLFSGEHQIMWRVSCQDSGVIIFSRFKEFMRTIHRKDASQPAASR